MSLKNYFQQIYLEDYLKALFKPRMMEPIAEKDLTEK